MKNNMTNNAPISEVVLTPGENDILFGRGKKYQDHIGNKNMRKFLDDYREKYYSLKRFQKFGLVETVHGKLVDQGARFLRKLDCEDGWVAVDQASAIQKVCHALRCTKHWLKRSTSSSAIKADKKRVSDTKASAVVKRKKSKVSHPSPPPARDLGSSRRYENFPLKAALQKSSKYLTPLSSKPPGYAHLPMFGLANQRAMLKLRLLHRERNRLEMEKKMMMVQAQCNILDQQLMLASKDAMNPLLMAQPSDAFFL
jgi:hypothetical protein